MNRKNTIFTVAVGCMVSCLSCMPVYAQEETALETGTQTALLAEVKEANEIEQLLEEHERIAFQMISYRADGSVRSSYTYKEPDLYAREEEGDVFVNTYELSYGFDSGEMTPYICLPIGFDEAGLTDRLEIYPEHLDPGEAAGIWSEGTDAWMQISSEEADGILQLEISAPAAEATEGKMEELGYTVADGDTVVLAYELEPASKEVRSCKVTLQRATGESCLTSEMHVITEPDIYQPEEQILSQLHEGEAYTMTVTAGPGTEQQIRYSCSVGANWPGQIRILCADGYDGLYTDAECTQMYEGNGSLEGDMQLYTYMANSN